MISVLGSLSTQAHDLFLKFETCFPPQHGKAVAHLMNGTFRKSENPVARDRMADVSLIKPDGSRVPIEASAWTDVGSAAHLTLSPEAAGTYVVGLYTKPREITLKGAEFNSYLAHDGIPDVLAARKRANELGKPARERYSKHVKALFQVGDTPGETFKVPLRYPVEIIPQQNPYRLKVGDILAVQCVNDGQPLANQFVLAGYETKGRETVLAGVRTNEQGVAQIPLKGSGQWYVKFIRMVPSTGANLDYESRWATLTFEIK